jgi:hypothetical protein
LPGDVQVGTEEVAGRRLVINGAVDILYNAVIVNRDQERGWVGASVVWVLLEKVLNPASPPAARSAAASLGCFEYGSRY